MIEGGNSGCTRGACAWACAVTRRALAGVGVLCYNCMSQARTVFFRVTAAPCAAHPHIIFAHTRPPGFTGGTRASTQGMQDARLRLCCCGSHMVRCLHSPTRRQIVHCASNHPCAVAPTKLDVIAQLSLRVARFLPHRHSSPAITRASTLRRASTFRNEVGRRRQDLRYRQPMMRTLPPKGSVWTSAPQPLH